MPYIEGGADRKRSAFDARGRMNFGSRRLAGVFQAGPSDDDPRCWQGDLRRTWRSRAGSLDLETRGGARRSSVHNPLSEQLNLLNWRHRSCARRRRDWRRVLEIKLRDRVVTM
eukprot:tig00020801_g13886.t1